MEWKNLQDTCLNLAIKDYNTNNCAENDWIYNINPGHTTWTMIANSAYTYIAFSIGLTGNLYNNSVTGWDGVFPVVYLKETTRITGGTGEENNPFILK